MSWMFWRRKAESTGQPPAPAGKGQIHFVKAEDGPKEVALKEALSDSFLRFAAVERAYLAKARVEGRKELDAFLCIASGAGRDELLIEDAARVFRDVSGPGNRMHVMFMEPGAENVIKLVSQPFYQKGA